MSSSSCFGQQLQPSTHPVTSLVLLVVVVTSLLSEIAGPGWLEAVVLIWNHTFMTQFYVWNLVSSSFVETSVVKSLLSWVGIAGLGPVAEEHLGIVNTAVFYFVVSAASGLVTSTGIFFAYIVTRQEYLLDLEVHGTFGTLAALAVAAAQRDPGASFFPGNAAKWFPMRYFPLVLVVLSMVARFLAAPATASDFPFVCVAPYAAWVYLRFFAHIVHGEPAGDVNEDFQLIMFFPAQLRRFIKPLCDFTYGVFKLMGFFQDREARLPLPVVDGKGGIDPASLAPVLPTPQRKDPIAERRRARAMKLLDEKFARLSAKPMDGWDEDDGLSGGMTLDKEAGTIGKAVDTASTKDVGLMASATDLPQAENGAVAHGPVEDNDDDDDDGWGMEENPLEKPVAFDNGETADSSRM